MLEICEKTYKFMYERNATASYLVIETGCDASVVNYQAEMIANNPNTSVLPLYIRRNDNELKFYYDITSKVSLAWLLKRKKLNRNEFICILCGIVKPLLEACGYLLKESSFVLNENYIFVSPDLTEVSLVYLPVRMDSDYSKSYKDLVLRLVTDLADIEENVSDNYLQRILGCVKQGNFSIVDFDKLLKELSIKDPEEADVSEIKNASPNSEVEHFIIPPQKTNKQILGNGKKGDSEANESKASLSIIIPITLLQILFAVILLALYKSQILNTINGTDPASAFMGVLLVLGAIDFLSIRGILAKREKNKETGADNKRIVNTVKRPDVQRKGNSKNSSETKSKLISIQKKPTNEIIIEDIKDEPIPESRASVSNLQCQTEFLGNVKDLTPYLLGIREGVEERIVIRKNQFIIGRLKEQVDYTCNNNAIGKIHAEIIIRDGCWYIKDLNSRNGTYVNNQRIENNTEYEIKNNDKVSLANSDYTFVIP